MGYAWRGYGVVTLFVGWFWQVSEFGDLEGGSSLLAVAH